jgi:hypothetical protein
LESSIPLSALLESSELDLSCSFSYDAATSGSQCRFVLLFGDREEYTRFLGAIDPDTIMTQETQAATQAVEEAGVLEPEVVIESVQDTVIQDLLDMPEQEFTRICHRYEGDDGFKELVERISKVIY